MLMAAALRETGYAVELWSEAIHPQYVSDAQPVAMLHETALASPHDVLIYHHRLTWPMGEHLLTVSKNRLILRHYGSPPKEAYAPYSSIHMHAAESSACSIQRILALKEIRVLGVSPFVCENSASPAGRECEALPSFHRTEELYHAPLDEAMASRYGGYRNIVLAGTVLPYRGHARAIRAFAEYRRHFQPDSQLILAGRVPSGLDGYVRVLNHLAGSLGVREKVHFTGALNASQAKALYKSAAVFLCASEYEGFSESLLEAMRLEVPIVALAGTSVSETVGYGSVLDEWDEFVFASHMARLIEESDLARRSIDKGRRRYFNNFYPAVLSRALDRIAQKWMS